MTSMRTRSVTALLAALALAAPATARAQSPTATPTVSPTPTTQPAQATPTPTPTATAAPRPKGVQRVYNDYRSDGVISSCRHSVKDLRRTLTTIQSQFDADFPDFRPAVQAAIARHKHGGCSTTSSTTPSSQPTPAPTAAPTVAPVPTTAPIVPSTTAPSHPESGMLPGGVPHSSGSTSTPSQASPSASPVPSATPAAPAVAPAPAATPGPPHMVVQREHADRDLTVPGALLGAALLVTVLLGLSALAAARSPRLAGMHHAWREAAYRTRGTWRDFSDWLRLGR